MQTQEIEKFRNELIENLTSNILPYWIERMTDPRGGFYGRRDGYDNLVEDAPKGAILNARILWTFSAAYNATGNREYLDIAHWACDFIKDHFIDRKFGGIYWSVDAEGEPLDTKKQFYAIAFMIYGLSEYYLATKDESALETAWSLFESIEDHARDHDKGGYIEASTRDWKPIEDMRLSDKDANASKTMNTHLHILEGYTNLLRALKNKLKAKNMEDSEDLKIRVQRVEEATKGLLRIFLHLIENPTTHHLTLFFDDDWRKYDDTESFGHDIEASWLLLETAEVIGDEELYEETLRHTEKIAHAGLEGRLDDGSMIYERHESGELDTDRHWWVQAENVIGQLYLARYHSNMENEDGSDSEEFPQWIDSAYQSWRFITENLVDPSGEWYWSIKGDGTVNRDDDKAGFWKCPYHNSRMCLESLRILQSFC